MESSSRMINKLKDDDKDIEKPPKTRQRSRSLFESDRPKLTETDRGVFVVSHADFPKKRTQSVPTDPDRLLLKPMLAHEGKIKKIIHDIFENALATKSYNAKECGAIAALLAAKIRDKVSELQLANYKLACTCIITKRAIPAPVIESGCVWNVRKSSAEQDSFVEFVYKSQELYALGTVYGIYDPKFEKPTSCKSNRSGERPSPIPE